jgi:hypothetical protein
MTLENWFWGIYVIALLFGSWSYYEAGQPWYRKAGAYWALWILLGILGYGVFGSAIKGH